MRIWILIVGCILWATSSLAATVTLTWDPNQETDLAGYKIYRANGVCTTNPQAFQPLKTVGIVATTTDIITTDGAYCYYITALDTGALESVASNKVDFTVNQNPPVAPLNLRGSVAP